METQVSKVKLAIVSWDNDSGEHLIATIHSDLRVAIIKNGRAMNENSLEYSREFIQLCNALNCLGRLSYANG